MKKLPRSTRPADDEPGFASRNSFSSNHNLSVLSRKLAPPTSGKQTPIRPIHPDSVVLAFSLVAPIFIYGIFTSQAGMLLPVVALLAGFYALYFWQRRKLIARFKNEQAKQKTVEDRVKRMIAQWMKLYYCAQDDGVFEPGDGKLIPLEQMMGYLNQQN